MIRDSLILFYHAILILLFACCSNGRRAESTINRDDELKHYFGGVADIFVDSVEILNSRQTVPLYKIPINVQNLSLIDAGSVLSLSRAVPLETLPENLIGGIDKIIYADSTFFILDRELGKCVYAFDYNGQFITTIGYAGRGPDEYIEPTDIFYNHCTKRIAVWDQFSHRFLEFDRCGNFIGSKSVPIRMLRCAYDNITGGVWCSSLMENSGVLAIDDYNAILLDSSYSKVVKAFDYSPHLLNYVSRGSNMRIVGDTLFYHPLLSDTIYSIGPNGVIVPEFHFDFQHIATLPSNVMQLCKGNYESFYNTYHKTEYAFCESEFFVTDRYLYANINAKRDRFTLRYKRGSDRADVILPIVAKEGFDLGYMQCANLIWQKMSASCYVDGQIITSLTLSELTILPYEERELLKVNALSDDANPVILVFDER